MMIKVFLATQTLELWQENTLSERFLVSSSKNGGGEQLGSLCTPRGKHRIRLKIGDNCPINTIFVGRRPSDKRYHQHLKSADHDDWVLTRILWLSGAEARNRNTLKRFIYIHGTPDSEPIGIAASKGCIRMRNHDIVRLFDAVNKGDTVWIYD